MLEIGRKQRDALGKLVVDRSEQVHGHHRAIHVLHQQLVGERGVARAHRLHVEALAAQLVAQLLPRDEAFIHGPRHVHALVGSAQASEERLYAVGQLTNGPLEVARARRELHRAVIVVLVEIDVLDFLQKKTVGILGPWRLDRLEEAAAGRRTPPP